MLMGDTGLAGFILLAERAPVLRRAFSLIAPVGCKNRHGHNAEHQDRDLAKSCFHTIRSVNGLFFL